VPVPRRPVSEGKLLHDFNSFEGATHNPAPVLQVIDFPSIPAPLGRRKKAARQSLNLRRRKGDQQYMAMAGRRRSAVLRLHFEVVVVLVRHSTRLTSTLRPKLN
jgi:hypothetical protein